MSCSVELAEPGSVVVAEAGLRRGPVQDNPKTSVNGVRVMRYLILLVVVQAALACATFADALAQDPLVCCPPAVSEMKVDGVLDELTWQIPAGIPAFVDLSGRSPQEPTQAWAAFSKDGVYLAFECMQARMSPANSTEAKDIWTDDSVEVFLDSDGDRDDYDHFILSARGATMAERGTGMGELDRNVALKWEGAARIGDGKWTAEVFVPYSTIGAKFAEGSVLRANLCRNNAALGENSCWTTLHGGYHQPLAFGNLVMGIPLDNVRFSASAGERVGIGPVKVSVTCRSAAKSDVTVRAVLYPGGHELKTAKPFVVPAGKIAKAEFSGDLTSPGRIDVKLVATSNATSASVSEASFSGQVMTATPKAMGGIIATDASWGTLWHSVSTFKVMRDTKPPSNRTQAVRLTAARNEYEPFQLVLHPPKPIPYVKVTPRALVGPRGAKIEAWNVTVRAVEYVKVTEPTSSDVPAGEYPDPLPETTAISARKGVNNPVWITIYVPAKAAPGEYTGAIDITAGGLKKLSVPIRLRVRSFELPYVTTLRTAFGCGVDRAAHYQGATTLEQKRKLVELYNLDFWRHRVAPYVPYACYDIKPTLEDHKITLDFSDFDVAVQKFFPLFNSFNLPRFGMGDSAGMDFGDDYSRLKVEYMRMVTEHLADKGQIGKGYNYIMDEPTEEQYKLVREEAELSRMADQRIKVLLTEQVEQALVGSVDIWVPVLPAYDESRSKARQAAGEEVWWYVCCGPHHPYPNNFIDYAAVDHRILPWITWRYGVNGILYWDTTYWRDNPWEIAMSYTPDGKGRWGNGDGRLLYPPVKKPSDTFVAKGPVPSIRWEMIREGIEDYDYFRILQDRVNRNAAKGGAAVVKGREALKLVGSSAKSRTEYARDPAKIESVRAKVAEAIEGLK